jgi:glycosyltransferase involved in cell wall biosynthesis
MTVAFLSVSSEMGGSEVSLLELVRGLRRLVPDWNLHVVVPREGPLPRAIEQAGGRAHVLPLPERLTRVGESRAGAGTSLRRGAALLLAAGSLAPYGRRLAGLLAVISPDIVHTNGFKMHVLGARAVPSGAALVWHLHEYVQRRPISRRLLRRYGGRCALVVANSRSVAAEAASILAVQAPVRTIHNAVDARVFAPDGPTLDLDHLAGLSPAPSGTVRIGLVATYGRWKGHATFLEAVATLDPSMPCRAYIIGGALYDTGGSQYSRDELAAAVTAAGLNDRVGLTGFIDRPADALRSLDVVVHASTQPEPFGLVIAEGLATGRAVVVSAAGGAAELVSNGVDALTHKPGDAAGLSRCLARLVADRALRSRLGTAGRASALRRFNTDDFVRGFIDVYQEARLRAAAHAGH